MTWGLLDEEYGTIWQTDYLFRAFIFVTPSPLEIRQGKLSREKKKRPAEAPSMATLTICTSRRRVAYAARSSVEPIEPIESF